jgi:hypothetical protein
LKFVGSDEEIGNFHEFLESQKSESEEDNGPMMMDSLSILTLGSVEVKFNYQQFDGGIGQPVVKYPQLPFDKIHAFFALGSPISMFLSVRGIEELGTDFQLPTCENMFNIFHPFDPCAYRIEPMVNPVYQEKPVLIPHHTGRKRFHLELRENLAKMGVELKNSIVSSMKSAMTGINSLIYGAAQDQQTMIKQNGENETLRNSSNDGAGDNATNAVVQEATEEFMATQRDISRTESGDKMKAVYDQMDSETNGQLNSGRRIDYVLQERPLEAFNDYLFAFQSHLCYWNSEDTVLMILRELYGLEGIQTKNLRSPDSPTTSTSESTHNFNNT